MAKLKYRVRVLLGDQELVLLVPVPSETTVGELVAEVLTRASRKGVLGSACEVYVDGAVAPSDSPLKHPKAQRENARPSLRAARLWL